MANSRDNSILNGKSNIVGNKIQQYREERNLSRQAISDKLMIIGFNISANSIYDIETGTRTVVDYEICAISKVLKIKVQDLLDDYYNSIENI